METIADVLRELVLQTPPNVGSGGWREAIPELIKSAFMARRVAGLGIAEKRDLLALFSQSGAEWLNGWFESDPIKALLGFDAIVGNYASPYTPGSAYVLLHHVFGEVNGRKGAWGHAIGGMGAITQRMAEACREHGVELRTNAAVREVIVEHGKAVGVVLEGGESVRGQRIISNLNPKLLFTKLVDGGALTTDFRERMERYRCGSGTFRMNVALSELPRFTCLPEAGPMLNAGIVMAPSLDYMDRAYTDARATGWSKEPIVEMLIPSLVDDTLAPAGKHVASLFCQQVQPELSGGRSWDAVKDEVAQHMIATVDKFAPGFAQSVIGYSALSPLDLERVFGLVGGDIMHGRLELDQMFSARPTLGHGNYRSPIKALYMCGSGTHPGGGVTGAPGHNAAREILRDAGKRFA
jgi:phytoene dehydrogenase-like protein